MDYITPKKSSAKWGISECCIDGVIRFNKVWVIPSNVEKPGDARLKENKRKTNISFDII